MTEEEKETGAGTDPAGWVDRHGDALFRFALLRIRDRQTAEELVQETLLAALKGRDRFEGKAKERTWLVQILRNKIVDHYRKRRREVPVTDLGDDSPEEDRVFSARGHWRQRVRSWRADAGDLLDQEAFLAALNACLEGLPERQAEVFALRVMDEKPPDEAAEILEVTKTNLGVLLHRARLKLRECLEATWFHRKEEA